MADPKTDASGQIVQPRMITHLGDGAIALTNRDIVLDWKVLTDLLKGGDDADGQAVAAANLLKALSRGYLFNGTTWDRQRNNEEITVYASATRGSGNNQSAIQTNYNSKGLCFFLGITAVTGTSPTLTLIFFSLDPITGSIDGILSLPTQTGTIFTSGIIYPGTTAGSWIANKPMPRKWVTRAIIGGTDTPTFTFSLGASYIN
ncbi:MAG: hypothetical protein Q8R28_12445 [Dehalococcoidia bacterium]|nr:hypothetical protein [Dehalococcoidia bacterium]